MPKIPVDRKMKRDNFEYLHSNKLAWCKWLDKRSVTILFSNGEGMAVTSSRASPDGKKKSKIKHQYQFQHGTIKRTRLTYEKTPL